MVIIYFVFCVFITRIVGVIFSVFQFIVDCEGETSSVAFFHLVLAFFLSDDGQAIALYGAETWTLLAVDQKHLESSEMWCWRRMEKISWTDHVRNEEALLSQVAEEYPT